MDHPPAIAQIVLDARLAIILGAGEDVYLNSLPAQLAGGVTHVHVHAARFLAAQQRQGQVCTLSMATRWMVSRPGSRDALLSMVYSWGALRRVMRWMVVSCAPKRYLYSSLPRKKSNVSWPVLMACSMA